MEKYRTFVPRFCALILDLIMLLPLVIIDELIKNAEFSQPVKFALFFIAGLPEILYYVVLHGLYGQTVGKALMKVRVLDVSESKMNFRQAIIRDLPLILFTVGTSVFFYPLALEQIEPGSQEYWRNPFNILILVWGIADIIVFFTNEKHRALHDYLAGTVVVRTNENSDAE